MCDCREITPQMVEAGSDRLAAMGEGFGYAYVAEEVYLAMERARRLDTSQTRDTPQSGLSESR